MEVPPTDRHMNSGSESGKQMTLEDIMEILVMALQSNRRLTTNRQTSGEDEGKKGMGHGNIKKPKKLLSDRFGSISEFANSNGNPCGTNIHPMNQELIDFETRMLKRKYDNLKVSVMLEGVMGTNQAAAGFTYKNGSYNLSSSKRPNEKDGQGMGFYNERIRNECNLRDGQKSENIGRCTSAVPNVQHHHSNEKVIKDSSFDRKGSEVNKAISDPLTNKTSCDGKTHEAQKRPFFYAEQNSVPPKKRHNMEIESQQTMENDSSTSVKNKEDVLNVKSNACHSNLQQGASTPSSTTSEQNGSDSSMLFEGRTLLKGGVMPRHIPKTVVKRDDKDPPSDPRLLKPDYGEGNILEYKVLLWHKDWLFDYTKKLLAARKSYQESKEHERIKFNANRDTTEGCIEKKEVCNYKGTHNLKKMHGAKLLENGAKMDSLDRESHVTEGQNTNTTETSVSRLIENVRNSSKTNVQRFDYEHSSMRKEITNNYDPRLKNACPQQFDSSRRRNNDYSRGSSLKAPAPKSRYNRRESKFEKCYTKQKYAEKSFLDRSGLTQGKTGAVLRKDKCSSPVFSLGKEEYPTLSTSNIQSTYNNKELSPIYQGNNNCNRYQNNLPMSHKGSIPQNPKGRESDMDIYPQFCREHWY